MNYPIPKSHHFFVSSSLHISSFDYFKVSKFPRFEVPKIPRSQDFKIPRFLDFIILKFKIQEPCNTYFPRLRCLHCQKNKVVWNDPGCSQICAKKVIYSNSQIMVHKGSKHQQIMKIEVFGTSIRKHWIWPVPCEAKQCHPPFWKSLFNICSIK